MKLFAERRTTFPDPRRGGLGEGIVDVSDNVSVARLLEAYSFGIFPWPTDGYPTLWFCPERRGILEFKDFHVPRSLRKTMRSSGWIYAFDQDFAGVIDACAAAPRAGQDGTWITDHLRAAFNAFHRAGYAHSLEVRNAEGDLVGGLYGNYVGGVFGGESMFHRVDDTSKAALVTLVEFLAARGHAWMDIQMVTPLLEAFGGRYVSRDEYLDRVDVERGRCRAVEFRI